MSGIDKIQFQEIFSKYYNVLCNFANTYLKDTKAAEDVVQDVFVKFWMKRASVQADKNVKSYLFQSTKNRAIEILRRNKLDDTAKAFKVKEWENASNLEEESDQFLLKEKLFTSIRQLPTKCQEVFKLSKLNGLTYSEIADQLDISVKTVENHMGKALKILRERLK